MVQSLVFLLFLIIFIKNKRGLGIEAYIPRIYQLKEMTKKITKKPLHINVFCILNDRRTDQAHFILDAYFQKRNHHLPKITNMEI